jgi:hypothetical protein
MLTRPQARHIAAQIRRNRPHLTVEVRTMPSCVNWYVNVHDDHLGIGCNVTEDDGAIDHTLEYIDEWINGMS